MHSAGFTILPQGLPQHESEHETVVRMVFLPGDYFLSSGLVLVVALSFDRAAGLQAVRCGIPCTPLMLFHQLGQMAFCGLWTLCQVQYRHGDCGKIFTDTEMVLLPVASQVELDFKPSNVKIDQCESIKVEERYARSVADHLMEAVPRNPYVHGLEPRQAVHRDRDGVSNDQEEQVALMQKSLTVQPLRMRLQQFVWQWFGSIPSFSFWIHTSVDQRIQRHINVCDYDNQGQDVIDCEEPQRVDPRTELVFLDPPPVLLVLPRPHAIVVQGGYQDEIPVLCQASVDLRHNLYLLCW